VIFRILIEIFCAVLALLVIWGVIAIARSKQQGDICAPGATRAT
jgi:hypothetical protein